jgi:hypothetical protein
MFPSAGDTARAREPPDARRGPESAAKTIHLKNTHTTHQIAPTTSYKRRGLPTHKPWTQTSRTPQRAGDRRSTRPQGPESPKQNPLRFTENCDAPMMAAGDRGSTPPQGPESPKTESPEIYQKFGRADDGRRRLRVNPTPKARESQTESPEIYQKLGRSDDSRRRPRLA